MPEPVCTCPESPLPHRHVGAKVRVRVNDAPWYDTVVLPAGFVEANPYLGTILERIPPSVEPCVDAAPDLNDLADAEKLYLLAEWFDTKDNIAAVPQQDRQVQADLRRIADDLRDTDSCVDWQQVAENAGMEADMQRAEAQRLRVENTALRGLLRDARFDVDARVFDGLCDPNLLARIDAALKETDG